MVHWLIYYKGHNAAGDKVEGNVVMTQRGPFDFHDCITQLIKTIQRDCPGDDWHVVIVNMIEIKGGINDTTSI